MAKWLVDESPISGEISSKLMQLGVPKILADYVARSSELSVDDVVGFIDKSTESLYDPFLLDGMEQAIETVSRHIDNQANIMVFGDFDVDGVTGASILYWGVRKAGLKFPPKVYIPNRFTEGHGLNIAAIDQFAEDGVKLVITADCGMGNHEEVEHARQYGIDVIITDHHMGENDKLRAAAVVNPRLGDYPFEFLSGAGVAYKFIQALLARRFGVHSEEYKSTVKSCLDYVAIGTVADVMPLIGENRILVDHGLKNMVRSKLPFLNKYWAKKLRKFELDEPFTSEHIGFQMAPRINAASRLETGRHAFEFLISVKSDDVVQKGRYLDFLNSERKSRLSQLKASETLKKYYVHERRILIIDSGSPEKGLFGLLASYFLESDRDLRAVLVLGDDPNGSLSGSARAKHGFDWFNTLKLLENYLVRFGGHAEAAGCMLNREDFKKFIDSFDSLSIEFSQPDVVKRYHSLISLDEISEDFVESQEKLGPYGARFPKPVFKLVNFKVANSRRVGPSGRDLTFTLCSQHETRFSGIGFRMGEHQEQFLESNELIVEIGFNYFRTKEIQLRLIDILD